MVKFAVVGHDAGFAISYALAADHPDRVDRRQTHAPQRSRFRVKADALLLFAQSRSGDLQPQLGGRACGNVP